MDFNDLNGLFYFLCHLSMPSKREAKVVCTCGCKAKLSLRTERRHLAGQATLRAQATALANSKLLNIFHPVAPAIRQPVADVHPVEPSSTPVIANDETPVADSDVNMGSNLDPDVENNIDDVDAVNNAMSNLRGFAIRSSGIRQPTVEEYESYRSDSEGGIGHDAERVEDDEDGWFGECDSEGDDEEGDMEINADFERELADFGGFHSCWKCVT